jgi:hypothetical protein
VANLKSRDNCEREHYQTLAPLGMHHRIILPGAARIAKQDLTTSSAFCLPKDERLRVVIERPSGSNQWLEWLP